MCVCLSHRCNSWSPFYKKERESEGLILSLETLRTRDEFLCENPINATCREVASKSHTLVCLPLSISLMPSSPKTSSKDRYYKLILSFLNSQNASS